ncbi:hypothetical protein COLO4_01016 [Corchorus olitorius]|uniref:Uncharacterized protein n=1 Tax=Corchorus olitorius TaxID=93759 RepID=A0A1R3L314_9ROSI|nr:hypothetical protein COLO4_01016 [Corchorus olitorius]
MPEHRLRGQAHLREQALRAATREVEDRFAIRRGDLRVADDRDDLVVLDIQQRARRLLGQVARHLLVDEVDHLLAHRRPAHRGGRMRGLLLGEFLQDVIAQTLRLVAPVEHHLAGEVDRLGIGRVQVEHRCCGAGVEFLLPHLAQQVAHVHRHIAEVDLDRARRHALVAHGAVVAHVGKLFPVLDRHAAARLFFVQEGLDEQRRGEDLVARAVQQVGARHVRGAHRLALAAAQAVLDRLRNGADVALLHDDRLVPHQAERRRIGVAQISGQALRVVDIAQQLALVEAAVRIDAALVGSEVGDLFVGQEFQLGDADAVLARNHTVQRTRQRHDAGHRLVGVLQHVVVIRVDGDVGVHVAVTGVHVQRHEHAAAQHFLVDRLGLIEDRLELAAVEDLAQLGANLRLPRHADRPILQQVEQVGVRADSPDGRRWSARGSPGRGQ